MDTRDDLLPELEKWLNEILTTEKPTKEISAFRFGIGEVEEGYVLYLAGSESYDEDDEWAANLPDFVAEEELLIPANEEQEWYWVLLNVIYCLGKALRKMPAQQSFLGGSIPVYTGFEAGDLYRIK